MPTMIMVGICFKIDLDALITFENILLCYSDKFFDSYGAWILSASMSKGYLAAFYFLIANQSTPMELTGTEVMGVVSFRYPTRYRGPTTSPLDTGPIRSATS